MPDTDDEIEIVYESVKDSSKPKETVNVTKCKTAMQNIELKDIPLPPEGRLLEPNSMKSMSSTSNPNSHAISTDHSSNCAGYFRPKAERLSNMIGQFRKWQLTNFGRNLDKFSKSRGSNRNAFTVFSYNLLAQQLLEDHRYLYRNHNPKSLSWDNRSSVLLSEIQRANADILCLQEVQASHLCFYNKHLKDLGYDGIFKQRTNGKVDGCAIYYKTGKFKLIEKNDVEYYQYYSSDLSLLDRDNVAIIARLELCDVKNRHPNPTYAGNQIVVATTHLLYNPRRHDIKLAQTQILLAELDRVSYLGTDPMTRDPKYLPIVLTGDFNLSPNSAVYNFLVRGYINYSCLAQRSLVSPPFHGPCQETPLSEKLQISSSTQHLGLLQLRPKQGMSGRQPEHERNLSKLYNSDMSMSGDQFWKIQSQNQPLLEENILRNIRKGYLYHKLNLQSVYEHVVKERNEVSYEATTKQDEWITVDYIFYSGTWNRREQHVQEGRLKLVAKHTLPTCHQCQELKYLPNFVCGSDHLSLMAQFLLTPE